MSRGAGYAAGALATTGSGRPDGLSQGSGGTNAASVVRPPPRKGGSASQQVPYRDGRKGGGAKAGLNPEALSPATQDGLRRAGVFSAMCFFWERVP